MKKRNSPVQWLAVAIASASSIMAGPFLHAKPLELKEFLKPGKKRESSDRKGQGWTISPDGRLIPPRVTHEYPWKYAIVTTTFWVGEKPTPNNPVPNHKSCWDPRWAENYGGTDTPKRGARRPDFIPVSFTPRQNPFYVALPYNDMTSKGHKQEASSVIPWFQEAYNDDHTSVCKGRWIAIRRGSKICYAQWEDAGPFRTDHWQYVFGNERPKPNLNKGAGLDVSPAVRDYLGMDDTDVTDWKFVDFSEVPVGPWATYGDNNTFVINRRAAEKNEQMVDLETSKAPRPGNP